jgi:hypothetical protein
MYEIVRNSAKRWVLLREGSYIATYSTKNAALVVAQILAGRTGTTIVVKGK